MTVSHISCFIPVPYWNLQTSMHGDLKSIAFSLNLHNAAQPWSTSDNIKWQTIYNFSMIIWQKMYYFMVIAWKKLQWSGHNQYLQKKINISQFTRRCSDNLFGPRSLMSFIVANCFQTLCFIFPVRISFTLKGTFHFYFSSSI